MIESALPFRLPGPTSSVRYLVLQDGARRHLNSALFRRSAAVVRDRCHIADRAYLDLRALDRPDRSFSARTWALDHNVHFLQAQITCFIDRFLSCEPSGVGRALSRTSKATRSSAGPNHDVSLLVGNRHDGVIEGCMDVCSTMRQRSLGFAGASPLTALPFSSHALLTFLSTGS